MSLWYPVLDPGRCSACRLCEVACVEARYPSPGGVAREPDDPFVLENRRLAIRTWGELPSLDVCNHCSDHPCVGVCPHHALLAFRDGRVDLIEARCTGCGRCISACDVRAIRRVTVLGVAVKCDGCAPLGGDPACVKVCPTGALSLSQVEKNVLSVPGRGGADGVGN